MKTFIFVWKTLMSFGGEKLKQVEIGQGNDLYDAFTKRYSGGALAAVDFTMHYTKGYLTGCKVIDRKMDKKVKTIVPDFYRTMYKNHEINFSFDHVFESTVMNNPHRFEIGYASGDFNNVQIGGLKATNFKAEDNHFVFETENGKHKIEIIEFSPLYQFEWEKETFNFGLDYLLKCDASTSYFIEMVKVQPK